MSIRLAAATGMAFLLVAGCQDLDPGEDSWSPDGPEVVNSAAGTWTTVDAWRVEEVLVVGAEREGDLRFGDISGVNVDGDGRIYVADKQAQQILVFEPDGALARVIGRPGQGPGEFGSNLGGVFVLGEHIVVPDVANQRVSRFDLGGVFLDSYRVSADAGIPIRWDVTGGKRLVAQRRAIVPGDEEIVLGDPVVTVAGPGEPSDTIATLPPGQSVQITGGIPKITQFTPEPVWDTTADGRFVTAMTSGWKFEVRDASGIVEWVASVPTETRSVGSRDREAVEESLREMYRRQGVPSQISEQVVGAMEFAVHLPALASVAFGPAGSLWVQHFEAPSEAGGERIRVFVEDMGSTDWTVFDGQGHLMGTVSFPVDFRPLQAVGDRFYGVARDELGVQSVRAFRITTE